MSKKFVVKVKGGAGSGNYGHAGRPGMVGGSGGTGGGGMAAGGADSVTPASIKADPTVKEYFGDADVKSDMSENSWANYSTIRRSHPDGSVRELSVYHLKADGKFSARVRGKPPSGAQTYARSTSSWGNSGKAGKDSAGEAIRAAVDDAKKNVTFKPIG